MAGWDIVAMCGLMTFAIIGGFVWIHAYMNGGSVTVYVNEFGEALPELLLLLFFCMAALLSFAESLQKRLWARA